jgi:hypothetical protein
MVNTTDIPSMARATDIILNGHWFGYFTLLIIGLVCFVYLVSKRYAILTSAAAAVWIMALTAIFLRSLDLLDNTVFWWLLVSVPIMVFVVWISGRE